MSNDFDWDWLEIEEGVMMRWDGSEPEGADVPYIRRGKDEGPFLTPEQEQKLMEEQAYGTEGFDIDFKQFRCTFNYLPLNLDEDEAIPLKPLKSGTTKELIDILSRESIAKHNEEKKTKYELLRVTKANYHNNGVGWMFYITIEVKDPSHDELKLFQAKIRYQYDMYPTKILICQLKPEIIHEGNRPLQLVNFPL